MTAASTVPRSLELDVWADGPRRPRLGLVRRILVSVGLGIVLVVVVFGLLALTTLNQVVDAAGREQVTVAQTVASEVAAGIDVKPTIATPSGDAAPVLPPLSFASIPQNLHVQILTTSGDVLEDTGSDDPGMNARHLVLLHSLMRSATSGYVIHRPGVFGTFAPHVVAYAPVPGHPSFGVIVQQAQPSALDAPDILIERLVIAGLLATILAVVAARIDADRVVRPLRALTAAAERFAVGDLTAPVTVDRGDEVGVLATSFEIMRQRLQQSLTEIEEWNEELEQRVARRTSELERRNEQLATINGVAESLSDPLDVTILLDQTLDRICDLTGYDIAAYRLVTADQGLSLAAARDLPESLGVEILEVGYCLCGRAAELKACQIASELSQENAALACRMAGIASAIAVPLQGADRVEGILFLGSRQERRFEQRDVDTLLAIGRQVGMAVANARLYAALQRRERERAQLLGQVIVAQEEERRRLANGLHDDLSQSLASILIGVESILQTGELPQPTRETVSHLRRLITTTLDDVHALAAELRPSLLDDIGLVAALERFVDDFQRQYGLSVDFQTVNVTGLHLLPAAETALFRIAQGALSNVAYHAAASTVSVLLQRRGDRLILVIEDDGKGFDVAKVRAAPLKDRLGLAGIEERAQLIGAHTTIESAPGHGTTIHVDLSVAENSPAEGTDDETTRAVGG